MDSLRQRKPAFQEDWKVKEIQERVSSEHKEQAAARAAEAQAKATEKAPPPPLAPGIESEDRRPSAGTRRGPPEEPDSDSELSDATTAEEEDRLIAHNAYVSRFFCPAPYTHLTLQTN